MYIIKVSSPVTYIVSSTLLAPSLLPLLAHSPSPLPPTFLSPPPVTVAVTGAVLVVIAVVVAVAPTAFAAPTDLTITVTTVPQNSGPFLECLILCPGCSVGEEKAEPDESAWCA